MRIGIGADHAGQRLKAAVVAHLAASGHTIVAFGTETAPDDDYPLILRPLADAVEHVDVNLLTLGERVLGESLAKSIVDAYLGARAQGGRHARRREQIAELDKGEPIVADRSRGMRRGT